MKVIIIPVSDRPECVLALHHSFILGQKLQSSVVGYHIKPHSNSEATNSNIIYKNYDFAWEAELNKNGKTEGHVKAQILFKNIAQKYNYEMRKTPVNTPCAMWSEKIGSPEKLFAIIGPVSDLIIVSRPTKKGGDLARAFMFDAVLNSSAPVLVLPQIEINDIGKRVCLAWNQSKEAILAVKAALPLLQQADEVNIITCGPENRLGPKANHLKKYLSSWNIKANHVDVKNSGDNQSIMKGYKETNSDLLVMGGYSRNRLRQQVFGGVSEYMLNKAEIPIFILHP